MTQVKASFDDYYKVYSPQAYTSRIVNDIDYHLPFHAASLLKEYLNGHTTTLNTVVLGSGHGLDVTALKYNYTPQDILSHWLHKEPSEHIFEGGDSRFKITMVDLYEQPLQFARDVGLCDHYYACNLVQEWPQDLLQVVNHETDLLICVGVTTYLGKETFGKIVKLVERSQVRYFCFSVVSYIKEEFISLFDEANLKLHCIGRFRQRDYADASEREKILDFLIKNQICSPEDEQCLMTSVYVASKE